MYIHISIYIYIYIYIPLALYGANTREQRTRTAKLRTTHAARSTADRLFSTVRCCAAQHVIRPRILAKLTGRGRVRSRRKEDLYPRSAIKEMTSHECRVERVGA